MIELAFVAGRNGGGMASCYVWCEEAKTGTTFSHPDTLYDAVARLCDLAEERYRKPCVCRNIAELTVEVGRQGELITGDERIEGLPARKGKGKSKGKATGRYGRTGQWRDTLTDGETIIGW